MIRIKRNDCNFWTNDPSDLIRQFFQKVDNAIHWINLYPADNGFGFPHYYPMHTDLSGG